MLTVALTALAACRGDETVRAYGGADHLWTLQDINGTAFPARATLHFPSAGQIAGSGPCNSFSASMTAPYPWFETGPIATTRMACPDSAAEAAFLTGLCAATLVEVAGDTLILSNLDGLVMVFSSNG